MFRLYIVVFASFRFDASLPSLRIWYNITRREVALASSCFLAEAPFACLLDEAVTQSPPISNTYSFHHRQFHFSPLHLIIMRFPFLIACILAFACISVAATDACTSWENFPAEISKPKTSKFALLLKPFQGVIDFMFHRFPRSANKKNAKDLPWTIATYPAYANQTEDGWNVHIHGNLHNRQPFSKKELNELALESMVRVRLVKSKWKFWQRNYHTLTKTELEHARPLMHEIASVPIKDGVIGVFFPACEQSFVLPTRTNVEGSFYGAITVPDECVPSTASNETTTTIPTTRMILAPCNVRTPRDDDVNNAADVFFVPPKGVTIIADIDDTLRVMDVWNVKQTLLNAFARPLTPWRDMPEVLNDLKGRIEAEGQNVHFHYLTDAPEMIASTYTPALTELYPPGSFDFRPVNFTSTGEMINARFWNVKRLMESYPERRFIAIGDTTNAMGEFPKDMAKFSPQIQCLLVRDVSATEKSNWVIADTSMYIGLLANEYLFFRVPGDLYRLSAKHIASLVPGHNPGSETHGCFDGKHKLRQSMSPSTSTHAKAKSLLKAFWWNIKCSFLWFTHRPNPKCPWDRLAGEKYYNGDLEPEVKLEPYIDHLPVGEAKLDNPQDIDAQGDDDPEAEDDDEGDDQGEDGQDEDDQDEDDQEEDDQDEGGLDHHGQNRTVQDVHDQDVDEQDAAEQDVGHQNIVMQDPEHRVHVLAGEDVPHHGHIIHADDQDDDHDRGHDEE